MSAEKQLLVEIIAYAPTAFYHCTHCEVAWRSAGVSNHIHDEQVSSSLPPDMLEDYQAISDWVREIFSSHMDQVLVKVIDAASLEGFIKTLQYRLRHYPVIVVNGKARFEKNSLKEAGVEVARQLETTAAPPERP